MTENNKPQAGIAANTGGIEGSATGTISPDCAAIMVYATFPNAGAAMEVGRALVEVRLAGCINILPSMTSIYPWEGRIETANEAVLIAKTIVGRSQDCMDFILARHPYDVPAILTLSVTGGFEPYLNWLRAGVMAKQVAEQ